MRPVFSALLLTTVLAAPIVTTTSALAAEPRTHANVRVRVYDSYRRDSHTWDRREERRYRAYLAARHRAYLAFQRQRLAHQREYWRWRHEREERFRHDRR